MYRVVIAEDELLMRQGLITMLHWERLGMQVAAEAANGREALAAIRSYAPEILITDLRMPVMDGLELIESVRRTDSRMRIVILTCLDEFSLAQRAMELGVTSYVLKLTAGIEEIEGVLEKIRQSLDAEGEQEPAAPLPAHRLLREQLFQDYLCRGLLTAGGFAEAIRRSSPPLPERMLCLARMDLPKDSLPAREGLPEDKIREFLLGMVNGILALYGFGEVFCTPGGGMALVLSFGGLPEEEAAALCSKILTETERAVRHYLGVPVPLGASGFADGSESLPTLYREADDALRRQPDAVQNPKLAAAMRFLQEHFTRNISLQDAADQIGVTPNYLSRLFLQAGLGSFTTLLNGLRVARAKTLLQDPACPVYRAGEQVGFPNATYFIRVFKKHTGLTPNEYRCRPREDWE